MSLSYWRIPTSEEQIVDIYFEEVIEILDGIDGLLNVWRQKLNDRKTLTEIRRAFHTIKGSGRVANVFDLSELAWKVENMLNQVIAGAVPPSEKMVALVTAVRSSMPRVIDALERGQSFGKHDELPRLMQLADTLAKRKAPVANSHVATETAHESTLESGLRDLNRKLEQCMQRANEALHRSEMALQQARQTAAALPGPIAVEPLDKAQFRGQRFGWPALIISAVFGGAIAIGILMSVQKYAT
jgi:chemotaxis protein histidine kinase CheA